MSALNPESTAQSTRRGADHRRRTGRMLVEALRSTEGLRPCGDDLEFVSVARAKGCDVRDFVAKQLISGAKKVTAVGVINRAWFDPAAMALLTAALEQFRAFGRTVVVLPERALDGMSEAAAGTVSSLVARMIEDAASPPAENPGAHDLRCHPRTQHDPRGCRAVMAATGRPCLG